MVTISVILAKPDVGKEDQAKEAKKELVEWFKLKRKMYL